MKDGGEQAVLIAGMVLLLAALIWIPDWKGMFQQYLKIIQYEVYGR